MVYFAYYRNLKFWSPMTLPVYAHARIPFFVLTLLVQSNLNLKKQQCLCNLLTIIDCVEIFNFFFYFSGQNLFSVIDDMHNFFLWLFPHG